ncbi:hypothetical protein HCN44_010862 [Aphidius gifuensis]|uniref:FYVE zinc finger domain-containing protein n=1 Tax=Aphidius gifuensis TaxID=684658 RepID=A0A835CJT1_APHGI|nr:hypothetical protein HCN44_010862 [Aphidius gifuensis]
MNQAFLPSMINNNHGHIVAFSSMAGVTLLWLKICCMMEALNDEVRILMGNRESNVKFTTIYPYMVNTGLCKKPKIRCCGRIFCADCSENSTPLPSEQLYNPVRVCSECFSRLHHHTSPCQCARNIIKNQDNDITEKTTITIASTTVTPTTSTTLTTTTANNNTDLTSLLCPRLKIISVSKEGCAEASLQISKSAKITTVHGDEPGSQ